MDGLELFPGIDLGARQSAGDSCIKPIGRRAAGRRRRAGAAPRRPPIAHQLLELRRLIVAQHDELMAELQALRQHRRNEGEIPAAVLRRITEIQRHLRLVETPAMPRVTRRRSLDG